MLNHLWMTPDIEVFADQFEELEREAMDIYLMEYGPDPDPSDEELETMYREWANQH